MPTPSYVWWVEMRLSGNKIPHHLRSAGVRGGKRASLKAAQESKAQILRADPEAKVEIWEGRISWAAVDAPASTHLCHGHAACDATVHEHGCYADTGRCDTPEEHQRHGITRGRDLLG